MSPENLKKIAHLELDISKDNQISVRKWDNEQTDRHTRILEFFGTSVGTFQECLQKISERYIIQNQSYKQIKLVETDERTEDERTQPLLELTPQGGQLKTQIECGFKLNYDWWSICSL